MIVDYKTKELISCGQCTSDKQPCTSCGSTISQCWHESLNSADGRMCNWCFNRYKEKKVYCRDCGCVPLPEEIKQESSNVGSNNNCPRSGCSSLLSQDRPDPSPSGKTCLSCNKSSSTWRCSWDYKLGMLCIPCGTRWESHHLYCSQPGCHFVPFLKQISAAPLNQEGIKAFNCLKCGGNSQC